VKYLGEKGLKISRRYLLNVLSELHGIDFLERRRSSYAEYRLKSIRPILRKPNGEVNSMAVGPRRLRVFRLDFFDYLLSLNWEDVRRIHDVRFSVPLASLDFVNDGWVLHDRKHAQFFSRDVELEGLRFVLQAHYGRGKNLLVTVKCANEPVAFDLESLTRFFELVNRVRSIYCCTSVSDVGEWTVVQWHFGRDTKGAVEGADFALSFRDWFNNYARIYSRHDGKVRVERIENPNVKVSALITNYREQESDRRLMSSKIGSMSSQIGSMGAEIREFRKKFVTSNY